MAYDIEVILTGPSTADILFSDGTAPAARSGSIEFGSDASYAGGAVGATVNGSQYLASIDFTGISEIHFHCLINGDDSLDRFFEATDAVQGTATVGASQVDVTWDSSPRLGMGVVTYTAPDGSTGSGAESSDVTSHDIPFPDLAPGQYGFQVQTDYEAPNDLSVVSQPSAVGFTVPQPVNVSPPGLVRASATPVRILVGQSSQIQVTVTDKDGTAQANIPVSFKILRGQAQGNLSPASGFTDASGACQSTFSCSGLDGKRRRGRCMIEAVAGSAGATKTRRAVVIARAA